jgi:hypothetical protein
MKGASRQLTQELLGLEVYEGGRENAVWLIDYLDRIDKHRLLITVGTAYSAMTFDMAASVRGLAEWAKDLPPVPISIRPAERYPVQEGTILFTAEPEAFDRHEGLRFTFDIAFGEPQGLVSEPVVPALGGIVDEIEAPLRRLVPLA